MTWTPRNRSEDEEEDENIDLEKNDDDEPNKPTDKGDSTDTEAGRWCIGEGEKKAKKKKSSIFHRSRFHSGCKIDCWLMVVYYL